MVQDTALPQACQANRHPDVPDVEVDFKCTCCNNNNVVFQVPSPNILTCLRVIYIIGWMYFYQEHSQVVKMVEY